MNFNIINGNDDYIQRADEFAKYYNNHDMRINEIKQKMGLSENAYEKLRKYCKENHMIKLRYKYNGECKA